MKTRHWMATGLLASMILFTGCGKHEEAGAGAGTGSADVTVDTASIQRSFASADPTLKSSADQVVALIKQGNYQGALQQLQTLAANAKLSEEQKKLVYNTIDKIKQAVGAKFQAVTNEAGKILGDVQKSLGK